MNVLASHRFSSQEGPAPSGLSARVQVAWTITMFGLIRAPQLRWWVLTTCAALGVFAPGDARAASCVLPSGLVAWWPGDGSGADLVHSNTLNLLQGTTYGPGQVGQALVFDGAYTRAQLPDVEALRLGKSLTIEGWIYPDSPGPALGFILCRADDRPGLDPYFLATAGANLYLKITDATDSSDGLFVGMPTNRWLHVAATLDDPTGLMRLYIDGVVAAEKTTTIRPLVALDPLSNPGVGVGNHPGYPISPWQFPFRGRIDELSVYDRALTGSEVAAIFAAGAVGKCKTAVLVRIDNRALTASAITVTNSATVQLEPSFPGGTVSYTLTGASPGSGLPYTGPFVVTQSVTLRAIAYDSEFVQSGEMSPLLITVVYRPSFQLEPLPQMVGAGGTAEFRSLASGTPPLSLQWYRNGVAIAGAVSSNLVLTNVQAAQAGNYSVVASNAFGSAASSAATLTVLSAPVITRQPAGTNLNLGQSATFCVTATGSSPLSYQWRLNGVNVPGATNPCITIPDVQTTNAGAYNVLVANRVDVVASSNAVLVILDFPGGPPAANAFAARFDLPETGDLEVDNFGATKEAGEPNPAGKKGGSSIWYRWTAPATGIATFRTTGSAFDTLLGVYSGTNVSGLQPLVSDEDTGGFLTSELQFNAVSGTAYQISVDGFAGAQGKLVLVWTFEPTNALVPVITNQPVSQTVLAGGTASFAVTAGGGTGLRYQWFQNGVRISGATNATLVRSNVQVAQVGTYAVAITNNSAHGVVSFPAVLEIGPFQDARSVDKVEDLVQGTTLFQASSAGASVSIGSIGTQILNTTNSTTSAAETSHCGVVGGSSRWFQLRAGGTATLAVDTFNSTFDTVLAVYISSGPGAYPSKLMACNDNAGPGANWSRVTLPATNGVNYFIAVDGPAGVGGPVQLSWALGSAPSLPAGTNSGSPSNQIADLGDALNLVAPITNGVPLPGWQWYLDGTAIQNATNRTLSLARLERTSGGTYSVVAANAIGAVTSLVTRVTVKVPLRLSVAVDSLGATVSGTNSSQGLLVRWSTNLVNWFPLYTNTQPGQHFLFEDRPTTNRARRFYQALPLP